MAKPWLVTKEAIDETGLWFDNVRADADKCGMPQAYHTAKAEDEIQAAGGECEDKDAAGDAQIEWLFQHLKDERCEGK